MKLDLDERDINIIGNALAQRPWGEVNGVMVKIDAQVKAAQQAAHDKAADERDAPSGASAPKE